MPLEWMWLTPASNFWKMRAACISVNRFCCRMRWRSSPPFSNSMTIYVCAWLERKVTLILILMYLLDNTNTYLLLNNDHSLWASSSVIQYLVIEDVVKADDIWMALAGTQQINLLTAVNTAGDDFNSHFLASCFMNAAPANRETAVSKCLLS